MESSRWLRILLGALLAVSFLTGIAAAIGEEPAPPEAEDQLPADDRRWLEEVGPLISEAEREVFLSLTKPYQRKAFMERFWKVRDPFPQTGRNELEEAWRHRLEIARGRFDDLTVDAARMLLLFGEPVSIDKTHCGSLLRRLEIWRYRGSFGRRGEFTLVFVQWGTGEEGLRLWSPRDGLSSLILGHVRVNANSLEAFARQVDDECFRGDQLLNDITLALDAERVEEEGGPIPKPSEEWLTTFVSASTDLPVDGEAFPTELTIEFPGRHQSRTVVQGVVSVDRGEVQPSTELGEPMYLFVVDGEVVRGEDLFESFRYRFQIPGATEHAELPLVFERLLRPGDYTLVLRVRDLASGRFTRHERPLRVPAVIERPAPPRQIAEVEDGFPAPALAGPRDRLVEANAALPTAAEAESAEPLQIRLLPPPPGLQVGNARIEAVTVGEGVGRVRFLIDGREVLSKRRPPYSVELQLGNEPRLHRVQAVAVDAQGQEIARDEIVLNAGPHRFAVRLVEPQRGGRYTSSLRAQVEVEIPEGELLERVELYLNETLLATLYQPPFVQPMVIPDGLEIAYVRAVAYLVDGNSTEDLVFVNAPKYLEEVDVQLVELYTTVIDRRGRPAEGLTRQDFRVLEDGVEQKIQRFEKVTDTPIYAGVLLDTSASMTEELMEALKGALRFFETVIQPKDRAAVITFNEHYDLAVRFTNNHEVLAGGLAGLTAEGETYLYDSLIYALYYFSGIKGKRAIILLSDGADVGSGYTYEDVLDYARRTGVTIYAIGLGLPAGDRDIQHKLMRLADETGGRAYFIDRARQLGSVYTSIENELRSQYLIAYQSSQEGGEGKFRAVEVEVARPGLEAKTIRGYLP